MARIIQLGSPHDNERKALEYLRSELSDDFIIYSNFHIVLDKREYEIDALVIGTYAVFLVEFKGTWGQIEISQEEWFRDDELLFDSPLRKIRTHAKKFKGLLEQHTKGLWVQASVVLTNTTLKPKSRGPAEAAGNHLNDIVCLPDSPSYFKQKPLPHCQSITHSQMQQVMTFMSEFAGKTQAGYRDWIFIEEIPLNKPNLKRYLAHKKNSKKAIAKLSAYSLGRLDDAATIMRLRLLRNQFELSMRMSPHQNIVAVYDAFIDDDEDCFIVVAENAEGKLLSTLIGTADLESHEQYAMIIRDVLSALDHAHEHDVIHRNLTPDAILINDKRARLCDFKFAGLTTHRTSTVKDLMNTLSSSEYAAPESYPDPRFSDHQSDLFSAGVIFYEVITGTRPFANRTELLHSDWKLPRGIPAFYYDWFQKLIARDPANRFATAKEALLAFEEIVSGIKKPSH